MIQVLLLLLLMLYSDVNSMRILMATGDGIFLTDIQTNKTAALLFDKQAKVSSLDYHYKKSYLYFISGNHIKRIHFNVTNENKVSVLGSKQIIKEDSAKSVAVDWIRDKIYWTKSNHHSSKVMESDLSGRHLKHVISRDDLEHHHGSKHLKYFGDIVVDSDEEVIFLIAAKKSDLIGSIIRTNLQGKELRIMEGPHSSTSIAIDTHKRRLFVVERLIRTIYSCDYDGTKIRMDFGKHMPSILHLSISENNLYYVNHGRSLYQFNDKSTSSVEPNCIFSANMSILAMKVFDYRNQLTDLSYDDEKCKQKSCSYRCKATLKGVFCVCPAGHDLDEDGFKCQDPISNVSTSTSKVTATPLSKFESVPSEMIATTENELPLPNSTSQGSVQRENKYNSNIIYIILLCSLLMMLLVVIVVFTIKTFKKQNLMTNKCSVSMSQVNCDEERLIIEM